MTGVRTRNPATDSDIGAQTRQPAPALSTQTGPSRQILKGETPEDWALGAYTPGSGLVNPVPKRKVDPKYRSEAMRHKIAGEVWIDVVVETDGTVGRTRLAKSLDRVYGLDEAAMEAAKQWLFEPGTRDGKPVAVLMTLHLLFMLH